MGTSYPHPPKRLKINNFTCRSEKEAYESASPFVTNWWGTRENVPPWLHGWFLFVSFLYIILREYLPPTRTGGYGVQDFTGLLDLSLWYCNLLIHTLPILFLANSPERSKDVKFGRDASNRSKMSSLTRGNCQGDPIRTGSSDSSSDKSRCFSCVSFSTVSIGASDENTVLQLNKDNQHSVLKRAKNHKIIL